MIEQDTVKLLRECDAGVKMGITSLEDMLGYVKNEKLKGIISDNKSKHHTIEKDIREHLDRCGDDGKEPNPMAKGMSWLKTNVKLSVENSDRTVADLVTDGCNMGVKSLYRYLNEYKAADEDTKNITKHLINLEETLVKDMTAFL